VGGVPAAVEVIFSIDFILDYGDPTKRITRIFTDPT
jgi:hypothetical protein